MTATITTAQCATELATDPRTLRKFLRADARERGIESPGKGARWELKGDARSLTAMRKRFVAWSDAQLAARAAAADDATESDD